MSNASNSEKIIIERLVVFKDLLLIRSVIDMLKTEEQRQRLIEWLDKNPNCRKTDVDAAVINIVF